MSKIRIIPLGGVRENGKNIYCIEINNEIFVLDCGLKYPENELLGIDTVIPDFSYLQNNINHVAGIFLTHGHADAIGALPYLISKYNNIPVFGSKLTISLARLHVFNNIKSKKFNNFHVINEKSILNFKNTKISFFKTTHSIPGSLGIVLNTDKGEIVYTGDFKFDQSAMSLYKTNFNRLSDIGKGNVLALLSDSSNSESPYEHTSEHDICSYIEEMFQFHDGRIIVASSSSNILRIQQIVNAAYRTNRKILLMGRNLEKVIKTTIKLGYLKLPNDIFISESDLNKLKPCETVILEAGKIGEPIKELQKMATNKHHLITIQPGDLVFLATTPTYAMETTIAKTKDMIYRADANVKSISDDLHAADHANKNDLQLMINLLKPKYLIPIQGEYRSLNAHAKIANEVGIPCSNIIMTKIGDVIEYDHKKLHLSNHVISGNVMIDGIGVGDIGNIVLRDRKLLSEDGIFIAVVTINKKRNKIISSPKLMSCGFIYMKENRNLISESKKLIIQTIQKCFDNKQYDWNELKKSLRDNLNNYLYNKTHQHPIILPIIMEVR